MCIEKLITDLKTKLPGAIWENLPLASKTTFKIGGAARVLAEPCDIKELKQIIRLCNKHGIEYLVLGAGSNLLVSDLGVPDKLIVSLNRFNRIEPVGNNQFRAEAGAKLAAAGRFAENNSLGGMEWAVGIPASVGGAVYMNAGAFSGDMSKVVQSVTVLKNNKIEVWESNKLCFDYRQSVFKIARKCVIISALLNLEFRRHELITKKTKNYILRRAQSQGVGYPSAGSVFKRSPEVIPAQLIDQMGLKGLSAGAAEISKVHSGYIVNTGKATAADVYDLIKKVQKLVYKKHKIRLVPEIEMWGEFNKK
ncbi:MAG: UDP-N-acetylmuramate dehydrogenase [Firmicutes bacterium]|nr:UDP-N-acetylmuramate dehydrogenase [Bacillota bacterium]